MKLGRFAPSKLSISIFFKELNCKGKPWTLMQNWMKDWCCNNHATFWINLVHFLRVDKNDDR